MDAGARGWRWSDGPVRIGARISAKLGQFGEFYPTPPSFTIGTSFISAAAACIAGTFSMTGGQPCEACEPGKFAPTDGALSCMDCPRGTYSNNTGSFFCNACDIGQSTANRSSPSATSCASYCHAGSFSETGIEPCQLCPRKFYTSKIGSTFCEKCPEGFLTAGQSPTGFATGMGSTNIAPDICYDGRDLFLAFEEVWAVTRNLMMRGEYQNIKAAKVLVLCVFVLCALDSNKDCMCQSHGRCQILNRASMILLLFSKE